MAAESEFSWDPSTYLELIRSEIPRFDELQEAAVAAVGGSPGRVLELGIGTGETTRRLVDAFPEARITGLDSSPEMVFRARELDVEVRLARMEDPLPDGPWDLVIAVLSVHHLDAGQKQDLLRRVREQSKALVIADVVAGEEPFAPLTPGFDHPEDADVLADWAGGSVVWRADDLAVISATYPD